MTPRPVDFNGVLRELIRSLQARATPGSAALDPPWADNPYPLRLDDDIAHLKRWLDSGKANALWHEISNGAPFNSGDAFAFVSYILTVRRAAKKADSANKEIALLNRRMKQRTPKVHKLVLSDRALSNRSDKNGSRQRTIFCRELSDHLHDLTGRRHYDTVAELCQIAFDYRGVVDARSARRESTRKRYR